MANIKGILKALGISEGVPVNRKGLHAFPNGPVIVPSSRISMRGIREPILGISDGGESKVLYPDDEHKFKGDNVLEIPLSKFQEGGGVISKEGDPYEYKKSSDGSFLTRKKGNKRWTIAKGKAAKSIEKNIFGGLGIDVSPVVDKLQNSEGVRDSGSGVTSPFFELDKSSFAITQNDIGGGFGIPFIDGFTAKNRGSDPASGLLDAISAGESAGFKKWGYKTSYDVPVGGDLLVPDKPLSEMTIGEVRKFQKKLIKSTKGKLKGLPKTQGSSAVGRYQLLSKTLSEAQDSLGFSDDDLFSQELQDSIAKDFLLERRGYSDFLEDGDTNKFQKKLSKEWASIADPDTGESYYGGQPVIDSSHITDALALLKPPTKGPVSFQDGSFTFDPLTDDPRIPFRRGYDPNAPVIPFRAGYGENSFGSEYPDSYNPFSGFGESVKGLPNYLSAAGEIVGASGRQAEDPTIAGVGSGVGGFLGGISSGAGIPLSLGVGAIKGFSSALSAGSAKFDREQAEIEGRKANFYNRTIDPTLSSFQEGGESAVVSQTEKGEMISNIETGDIFKVHSREKHEDMDKDFVTDMLGPEFYVHPSRYMLTEKDLDQVIGYTNSYYSEDKKNNVKTKEIKWSDIFGEEPISYADAMKKVQKNAKLTQDEIGSNAVNDVTNSDNRDYRRSFISFLMGKNEERIAKKENKKQKVQSFQEGSFAGIVPPYDPRFDVFSGFGASPGYPPVYGSSSTDFNFPFLKNPRPNILGAPPLPTLGKGVFGVPRVLENPLLDIGVDLSDDYDFDPTLAEDFKFSEPGIDFGDDENIFGIAREDFLGIERDKIFGEIDGRIDESNANKNELLNQALDFYRGERSRNLASFGVSGAALALRNNFEKPKLKNPFLENERYRGISGQELEGQASGVVGDVSSLLGQINDAGGSNKSISSVLAPALVSRLLKESGNIRSRGLEYNAKQRKGKLDAAAERDQFNADETGRVNEANRQTRNGVLAETSKVFGNFNNSINESKANELRTDQNINRQSRAEVSKLEDDKFRLRISKARGQMTQQEYDIAVEDLEQKLKARKK